MYIPRRRSFSQLKKALARAYAGSSVISCTTRSGEQAGLLFGEGVLSAGHPSPRAFEPCYLVYCYGNGMDLQTSYSEFARFRRFGFTVLIPEYLGYGMSSGQASESGCYEAAEAAYRYLTETLHVPPAQIVVSGWSPMPCCHGFPSRLSASSSRSASTI